MNLPTVSFDCNRTCPQFEKRDFCRFNALFSLMGVTASVNSHTVSVKVEFKNLQSLADAVASVGGIVLGVGRHRLFSSHEEGFGFRLPGWSYCLVAKQDGTLAYDDYGGAWGNVADLETLKAEYTLGAAKNACDQLGWAYERNSEGLTVYHPSGGTLAVGFDGEVDANGFNGRGCHAAASELAVAIGKPIDYVAKPEFYQSEQRLQAEGE